jgi:hypothetical protein
MPEIAHYEAEEQAEKHLFPQEGYQTISRQPDAPHNSTETNKLN